MDGSWNANIQTDNWSSVRYMIYVCVNHEPLRCFLLDQQGMPFLYQVSSAWSMFSKGAAGLLARCKIGAFLRVKQLVLYFGVFFESEAFRI